MRLTPSLNRWGKVSWLCCVQVPGCCWPRQDATNTFLAPLLKPASNTFRSDSLLLLVRLNLGFLPRENLLPCSSYLPLGVSNGSLLGEHQTCLAITAAVMIMLMSIYMIWNRVYSFELSMLAIILLFYKDSLKPI